MAGGVGPTGAAARLAPQQKAEELCEKAVALPKEGLVALWRRLDLSPGLGEWPALPRAYSEVVAWSDLHADRGSNMEHMRSLPELPDTVLLVAGDLATSLEVIESSLRLLQQKFGAVFYVPGNHELWVSKKEGMSSVHKFLAILQLCDRIGVHTRPAFIGGGCAICPLFSWYKDNLCDRFSRDKVNIPFDVQTVWPWDITGRGDTHDAQQPEIADFFLGLNTRRLEIAPAADGDTFVVTMSHFVPRQECYQGPRRLCGVMGCRELEEQVRRCGARCHVFGHSHIAVDREVEGVRYLQHPMGYPGDHGRKTWPVRIFIAGAAVPRDGSDRRPQISERTRLRVLGGELKWLVWNSIWLDMNTGYAAGLAGRDGHAQSHAQKIEKAKEDLRRVEEHTKVILASGVCGPWAWLEGLRAQAAAAGREAGAACLEGRAYREVEALPAPEGLDEGLWPQLVKGVHLAAAAVTEMSVDEFFLRKKDERWELNKDNWMKAVHFRKGQRFQKNWEEHWHKNVADPDALEATVAEVPAATLSEEVRREVQDYIAASTEPLLERPPGRWSSTSDGGPAHAKWDAYDFSPEAERVLRAELDGDDGALEALWSAPPAEREVEIVVTQADDVSKRAIVRLANTLTVFDLKERVASELGTGLASKLVLSTADDGVLNDEELLSAVECEIAGGVAFTVLG